MSFSRRRRGFERLGEVGPDQLDLSRRDARRLLLEHAWRAVAGEALAQRLRAVRVSRGSLEVEAEPNWADALAPLVPRVASRLAARFPELGVRRVRLRVPGEGVTRKASPVAPEESAEPVPLAARRPPREAGHEGGDRDGRLRRAAERYLSRGRDPVR